MAKKVVAFLSILLCLSGCMGARDKLYDTGRVVQVEKIAKKNMKPKKGTAIGAGTGTGVGAGFGAAYGAAYGAAIGIMTTVLTLGTAAPSIPALTLAGAGIGAGVGAGGGAIVGSASGYGYDFYKAGDGTFEYKVALDHKHREVNIIQIDQSPLKINQRVKIVVADEKLKVEPLKGETKKLAFHPVEKRHKSNF